MKVRVALFAMSAFTMALALFVPTSTALAVGTTRYVKTTGVNASPCSSASPCRTIAYAVSIAASGDTIKVGAGTFTENVNVFKNLTITGAGAANTIVDGGGSSTVFVISTHATATIQALKIRNGKAGSTTSNQGGGVFVSGGCTLTMTGVKIAGNSANSGGGVSNYGTLTLTKVTIAGNHGNHNTGGGLSNNGTATINQSRITNNYSPLGGAIYNPSIGTLTVKSTSIDGNTSTSGYPGIYNEGAETLTNTTISGNTNSTGSFSGAGIYQAGGSTTLNYVTISNNTSATASAISTSVGNVNISNSIIYGNGVGLQCGNGGGSYTDGGYNVFADSSCGLHAGTGSKIANPQLKPLAANGGYSPTQALKSTSAAINLVPLARCVAKDQRGVSRPQGTKCDAGAYEYP